MSGSKYHSTRINSADGKFDSALEYKRWCYLKVLEAGGEIKDLKRQVPYVLIPTQHKDGKVLFRECKYVADFVYTDKDGNQVVIDAKGFRPYEYELKRKMMRAFLGITIKEV